MLFIKMFENTYVSFPGHWINYQSMQKTKNVEKTQV